MTKLSGDFGGPGGIIFFGNNEKCSELSDMARNLIGLTKNEGEPSWRIKSFHIMFNP
jgi:hypothetical protein